MNDTDTALPKKPWLKTLQLRAGFTLLRGVYALARLVPLRMLSPLGRVLGGMLNALAGKRRQVALRNLTLAYPEMSEADRKALCRSMFINFAKTSVEFMRIPTMTAEQINQLVRLEHQEYLDEGLARGKGVILITAHFGNWELMGAKLMQEGYQIDCIVRSARLKETTEMITKIRQSKGMRIFVKGEVLPAVRALRHNRILAILSDQHDYEGIFVDFFGVPAKTSVGPASIALLTGATLVPFFAFRMEDDTICGRLFPPFLVESTGEKEADIRRVTEQITQILEEHIREAPEQWLWLHGRWKTSPGVCAGEPSVVNEPESDAVSVAEGKPS
ncbi:MAG: lysophospholipid acyltransferase family protein [Armatimonadota bacterium]